MLKELLAKLIPQSQVDELVRTELKSILEVCKPVCIFLFGSAARGTMTTASDLDFLVVLPDNTDLKDVKQKFYCRRPALDCSVDIIFMHKSSFDTKSRLGGVPMICRQEGLIVFGGME